MIIIQIDRQTFAYDVHSLVKAFYPEQDVHVGQDIRPTARAEQKIQQNTPVEQEIQQSTHAGEDGYSRALDAGHNGTHNRKAGEAPEEETGQSLRLVVSFVVAGEAAGCEDPDAGAKQAEASVENEPGEPYDSRAFRQDMEEPGCTILVRFQDRDRVLCHGETLILPGTPRTEVKNKLKRLLYRMLQEQTGKTLPWGTLTGIRPTKIAMGFLKQGWKNVQIAQYMRETYYTSKEKTALAIAIANRERHILENINFKDGYSLYVGIPFCPSICLYCSFSSSPIQLWRDQVDAYLGALCKEIDYVSEELSGRELNTVYIGGGTPTTLEPRQLDRLLTKLENSFCFDYLREFTVEAGRPDSITAEKLQVLKEHGISRISINPQTMNQATLDFIGRKHTVEEIIAAFELARRLGFDNINMDLIVGLPGEGMAEVEHTMQELAKLGPDSVTVHSLAIKRASRLRLFLSEDKLPLTMTNSQEIMEMTVRYAQESGMHPYYLYRQKNMAGNFENVGYAKEGKEGIYNILIMEEMQSILALGAGAATKLAFVENRIERIENVKDIRNYIDRIDEMIERKRSGLYEWKSQIGKEKEVCAT